MKFCSVHHLLRSARFKTSLHGARTAAIACPRRALLTGPPVGVARALKAPPIDSPVSPTLFTQDFSLADRVALVTGAHRGIGLEMAMALAEAGARSVYCLDLPKAPDGDWQKVRDFVSRMGMGKLEYIAGDVRDQEAMWKVGETIGDREGRLDVCIASAGTVAKAPCLTHTAKDFQAVMDVNTNGALFTAQAAGQQMSRFGKGGSIILISSLAGSFAPSPDPTVCTGIGYHSSKAAVLQMARSLACELGSQGIRVNTVSPGFVNTKITENLDSQTKAKFIEDIPLGRFASLDEMRGVAAWLASDASSFCTGSDIKIGGGMH